jgi:hypothetical protein
MVQKTAAKTLIGKHVDMKLMGHVFEIPSTQSVIKCEAKHAKKFHVPIASSLSLFLYIHHPSKHA